MTAARRSRRGRQHPALLAAELVLAVIVGLDVLHALGWLLVVAAVAGGAYLAGRNRRPVVRAAVARTGPAPVQPVTRPATSGDGTSWTGGPVVAQIAAIAAERDQLGRQLRSVTRERDKLARQAEQLRADVARLLEAGHSAKSAEADVRQEVRAGLAGLGWPGSTTRDAIEQAMTQVRDSGEPVTTAAVLAAVLREVGNRRFAAAS